MSILLNVFEVFDPIKDFYSMRHKRKGEILFLLICPILIGIFFLIADQVLCTCRDFSLDSFTQDFLNQMVTMLTLFISFSMAYLSIIITSSSQNVDNLKTTLSKIYKLKRQKNFCSLYQVLICEITYTLVVEICYLFIVLIQKFLLFLLTDMLIKYIIAINTTFFTHILIMMLITVKDIYYSFWKST